MYHGLIERANKADNIRQLLRLSELQILWILFFTVLVLILLQTYHFILSHLP